MERIANACAPFLESFGTRTGTRAQHPRGAEQDRSDFAGNLRSRSHSHISCIRNDTVSF
jgi:hypothetical protein